MKRIYGFDIGTTSIGWAVIEYDVIQCLGRVLAMGARIFPEARDPKGTPLNQNRRQKRLVRRQIRRRKQRRRALNELLAQNSLLPPFSKDKNSAWAKVMALSPLPLRKKGLTEQLAPHELGRALYHLARLRHFKGRDIEESDKPDEEESAEEKEAKSARDITIKELKASGQTLGQMLAERVPAEGEVPKQQTRRIHALRSHVEDEFSRLIKVQESYHPALRDPAFAESLHETIFAQRPVFWRKNTLGQCRFIPGAPLCPKGSWLSQQRRMLEKLNNLAIVGGNMRPLDPEERAAILDKLQTQASMTWAGVRTALKPLYKKRNEQGEEKALRFNLELGGESKLIGNALEAKLADIFRDSWVNHPHKQAIREAIQERLWKADYGEIGEQRVVILSATERHKRRAEATESFVRDFGISGQEAKALGELKLPAGWEPYSIDTLNLFLPKLEEGIRFGALTAGPEWAEWRDINFPNREQPTGEILDRLPSPADREEQKRQTAIRNPTVVRTQNELRKVVNNLIEAYGKPDLIRVELAREVGLSKREREEMQSRLGKQEKRRRDAEADLKSKGIALPSRADIEKWLLWKEGQERCPYTGDQISFDALFRNGQYDVEHIWPRSRSLDDSFRNKTLCRRDVNIAKGNRTPFEFYKARPDEWSAVAKRLQGMVAGKGTPGMPLGKVKRFLAESMPDDFANRQLTDTGYAARQAIAFLKRLWPDVGPEAPVTVQAVTGRVTAQLRRLWELNNILSSDGEKTRADHRHHAIDALVVACTDPGVTNRLSRYWQQRDDPRVQSPKLDKPWANIRIDAQRMKDEGKIKISHRVRKKISGPLHGEMPFGDTSDEEVKNGTMFGVYVKKMPIEKLSLATLRIGHVSQITRTAPFVVRDPAIRQRLAQHLEQMGGDPKKAYPPYPRLTPEGPEIRKVRVLSLQQKSLMAPVAMKNNDRDKREPTGFADLANNHHISVYRRNDGVADFEIVSLYEASHRLTNDEPVVRRKREGAEFIMSLSPGDAIEFPNGDHKGIRIVQGVWASGVIVTLDGFDAVGDSVWRPSPSTILARGARKVSIDPIGRIRSAND
jgi:CRISPR-associated endonuclease Csn1